MTQQVGKTSGDRQDATIVAALREVGVDVASVYDLVNQPSAKAIPVLVRYLPEDLDPKIKEGIVRALSIKQARPFALRPMIVEFMRVNIDESLRWAIGNAIEVLATDAVLEELLELVQETRYGRARQMVVLGIGKLKAARQNPVVVDVLIRLLEEDEVRGHAIAALGQLRALKAREKIKQFLAYPNAWIRRETKTALKRIDKVASETP